MSTSKTAHLVLMKRDMTSRQFVEADRLAVGLSETQLATAGAIILTSGDKKAGIYGLVGGKLVKLGAIDKPSKYGARASHPPDARRELWLRDGDNAYKLTGHEALLESADR